MRKNKETCFLYIFVIKVLQAIEQKGRLVVEGFEYLLENIFVPTASNAGKNFGLKTSISYFMGDVFQMGAPYSDLY